MEAARDRQIDPSTGAAAAKRQRLALMQSHRFPQGHGATVYGRRKVAATQGKAHVGESAQDRPEQRDFQHSRRAWIADQQVCQTRGKRVHRAGHDHAVPLMPPSAKVLHRRQQARRFDAQERCSRHNALNGWMAMPSASNA